MFAADFAVSQSPAPDDVPDSPRDSNTESELDEIVDILDDSSVDALSANAQGETDALESQRNEAGVASALTSLSATKLRTGALASRADLHRIIKKYALSPIDAAELEARAEDEGLIEIDSYDELEASEGSETDSVRTFLDDSRRYRLLRPEEHNQLARAIEIGCEAQTQLDKGHCDAETRLRLERLADEGRRARARFVASNVRLVVSVAKNYLGQGLDFADIIQEGCCGLMRAVELFRPKEGTQFSTYAYWWIKQAITRAIADKSRLVRLPVHIHDTVNRIRRATRDLTFRFGREPSHAEVAEHLGLPTEKVAALSQWFHQVLSLEAPASDEGEADFKYFIAASEPPVDEQVVDGIRDAAVIQLIEQYLDERQSSIVKMRFGLNDGRPMTLEEIGQKYGVTRERIRQIESKALKILRKRISASRLMEN